MMHDLAGRPPRPLPGLGRPATRLLLSAACGLVLVAAAGCSGSTAPGGAVNATVTVAAVPGVDTAPIYLAQKNGLFDAAGLHHIVIHTYPTQTDALSALQGGQANIAASDYGDIFYAQSQNPDLKILADGFDATPGVLEILTLPGSQITSPADLANQNIGVPNDSVLKALTSSGNPVSLDAAAATAVLSTFIGNDAESVNWIAMSQQDEVSRLQNHQIPAILVSEPYIIQAETTLGAVEVLDACSGSTANLPLSGYAATQSWVKANPAAVTDFQAALAKAQTQASMTGQVQQLLPKTTGTNSATAALATIGDYPTTTSAVGLERVTQLMADLNMIKSGHDPVVPQMIVKPAG